MARYRARYHGLVRNLLQRLSRGVVLKRSLPERFGGATLFVSPDASLRYWKPSLETADPKLYDSVAELVKPGDTVWDVGANVGLFAFTAAHYAGPDGRVLALEPDSFLSGLLHRSASALPGSYAPVDILPVAVSDTVGLARLSIAGASRASNSLGAGRDSLGGVRETQSTLCLTLDWLLDHFPPPNVLKIDVEGLELAVLRGAEKLLTSARPRIHCEMSSMECFHFLKDHGYELYDEDVPLAQRQPLDRLVFNVIALPL